MTSPLLLLAEKVEGLEGPDREVDGSIASALGLFERFKIGDDTHVSFFGMDDALDRADIHVIWPKGGRVHYTSSVNPYTAQLDAALLLVPGGARWRLGHDEDVAGVFMAQCTYSLSPAKTGFVVAYSRSAACALCAAALRARAAIEAGE